MEVWVIRAFSAEQWSESSWVDSVWATEELALEYLSDKVGGRSGIRWSDYAVGPFDDNPDEHEEGHFLCSPKSYVVGGIDV